MNSPIVDFHSAGWADRIAADVDRASMLITLSALSFAIPRKPGLTGQPRLWAALCDAVERRVSVSIYIPAMTPSHPATAHNNSAAYIASRAGMSVIQVPMPRLLHAKTVQIDAEISWIGSGNFTTAAASHNFEAWIRTTDRATAAQLNAFYRDLLTAAGA